MKNFLFSALVITIGFSSCTAAPNPTNGKVISEADGLTVIQVSGTHYERGVAYGELLAPKIMEAIAHYIRPSLGQYYDQAKQLVQLPEHFNIPEDYLEEAKGIAQGIRNHYSTKKMKVNYPDEWDILLSNSLLDIQGILTSIAQSRGCSSLISWGDATKGTEFEGQSIITRHVDWSAEKGLIGNNVIVVHNPSEEDEQPWAMIGFAGQIGALSGVNSSGVGAFQHVLFPSAIEEAKLGQGYTPIWMTLREGLEQNDYNQDGKQNVNDILSRLSKESKGFADTYTITTIAPSSGADNEVAAIAELGPKAPYIAARTSKDADEIKGDNLYAANHAYARHDLHKVCMRTQGVIDHLDNGTSITEDKQWELMSTHSNCEDLGWDNLQMMQFNANELSLKISLYSTSKQAYDAKGQTIELAPLFNSK